MDGQPTDRFPTFDLGNNEMFPDNVCHGEAPDFGHRLFNIVLPA